MSINTSIKSGKGINESSERLVAMQSSMSQQKKESMIKRKRGAPSFLDKHNQITGDKITKEDVKLHVDRLLDPSIAPADLTLDVQFFRKLLSTDHFPPIDLVIGTGILPRIVTFLAAESDPILQYEASWVITNIASGNSEQTAVVVDAGCLPYLVELLKSPNGEAREQAAWALGNIAGDNHRYRDSLIEMGVCEIICQIIKDSSCSLNFLKNGIWLLSNMCRIRDGKAPNFEKIKPSLYVIREFLANDDDDVAGDACWSFAFVTDCNRQNTKFVLSLGILPQIITLMGSSNPKVVTPALRCVGNVLAGDDEQTQLCLDSNILFYLHTLLSSSSNSIVKEATWCISNITAGTEEQIQRVIDDDITPIMIEFIKFGKSDIQKEACWTVCNSLCGGSYTQLYNLLLQYPVIEAITSMFRVDSEDKLKIIIVDSLDRALQVSTLLEANGNKSTSFIRESIMESGFLDRLESIDLSEGVYNRVNSFVTKHFGYDDTPDEFPEY